MNIFQYIEKFRKLPDIERILLIKGILLSYVFQMIVSLLPLRFYFNLLKSDKINPGVCIDLIYLKRIVEKSIDRIERIVPWKCTCLNKVLISKYLYKDFGIQSEINLCLFENSSGSKCAHATLTIENRLSYLNNPNDSKPVII